MISESFFREARSHPLSEDSCCMFQYPAGTERESAGSMLQNVMNDNLSFLWCFYSFFGIALGECLPPIYVPIEGLMAELDTNVFLGIVCVRDFCADRAETFLLGGIWVLLQIHVNSHLLEVILDVGGNLRFEKLGHWPPNHGKTASTEARQRLPNLAPHGVTGPSLPLLAFLPSAFKTHSPNARRTLG